MTDRPYPAKARAMSPAMPATPNPGWVSSNATPHSPSTSSTYTAVGVLTAWRTRRTGPISWNLTATGRPFRLAVASVTEPFAVETVRPSSVVSRSGRFAAISEMAPICWAGPAGRAGPVATRRIAEGGTPALWAVAARPTVSRATWAELSLEAVVAR